jgi:hypothetical protein
MAVYRIRLANRFPEDPVADQGADDVVFEAADDGAARVEAMRRAGSLAPEQFVVLLDEAGAEIEAIGPEGA